MPSFDSLDLHPRILDALKNKGYKTPTPIQEKAIPYLLDGRDLIGIAQTGTGKTAAFSLPMINFLEKSKVKVRPARVRSLILTPTRELASQIDDNIREYARGFKIKTTVIFGGVGPRAQIKTMSKGVDILVATPGRLLDLMGDGHIVFDQIEMFTLDEADRMLDMGFIRDIKKIIAKLPKKRQTILFSATMPKDIAELAGTLLNNPARVEVSPESTTVERIRQSIYLVAKSNKQLLLKSILKNRSFKSVLVFTKTKHGANRVVQHLEKVSIEAAAIHGNKSQNAREKALGNFREGKIRVLVATDIAARGIDITHVTHVINFDIPNDPKSYVHRIGRTARAGREGIAISFCDETELKLLKDVEKLIKMKIKVDEEHEYHGVEGHAVKQTRPAPRQQKKKTNHKNNSSNTRGKKKSPGGS